MAFVKLDCGILDSSLWYDRTMREVFITALLMAEPIELMEPMEEFQSDSLTETGWIVPPGWYGFVHAASIGIIGRAGVPFEEGMEALKRLAAPEKTSRTPDHDGRRLVRVNGGFVVLNFEKYRKKDHTAAERSRRYREKQFRERHGVANAINAVTTRSITQAEAEAEAERDMEPRKRGTPTPFRPPTLEQVQTECAAKGYTFNPKKFHAFYSSKGWMVGKNKMKNWKQAALGWEEKERPAKPAAPHDTNLKPMRRSEDAE